MQDDCLGFWPFPIFTLNQAFIKDIWENQFLKFFRWEQEAKNIILNKYNCSGPPSIRCQRYEVYWAIKPKFIPSLPACKYHSINLLYSSNDLCNTPDFRVS